MASTVNQNSSDVQQLTTENSALNAKMQLLIDQIGDVDLSELCKSAAASFKRRHDDQEDPDLHEGEREPKRQRTEAAPSSTAPASSSQQQQTPASTSAEPEEAELQPIDDIVNQPVGDFRIPDDRIDSLMVNEGERQSVRDIRAQTKDLLAYQPPISEPTLDEEEETSQVAEDPATKSSDPTPAISTGPSQSAVEPASVSQQPSSPQQQQEEEPITFTHEGERIHPGCANPRSDLWNPEFFFEHQGSPLPPTSAPPPAELPNENWAPFDIRTKRPIEPLTKVKSSRGKVNVEGDLGIKRNIWKDPYLEEECEKYYVHTKRTIRFQNLWGIKHWTRDQRLRFWTLLHTQRSHRNAVVSDSRIELLNNVTISWIRGIRYSTFYAERFDQSKVVFNDFDFEYLQIDDVHTVYKELCRFTNQNWVVRAAKENVEMFIKLRCRTAMLCDFQMALEARQERVNETRPNLFFDEVDSIQTLTVL